MFFFNFQIMVGCVATALLLKGVLNPWVVGCVVLRDVALVAGVAVFRYRELPPAQRTWARFFEVADSPTHEIVPNMLSKFNTGAQMAWLSVGLGSWAFGVPALDSGVVDALGYSVLLTTAASGLSYALKRGMKKV